MNAEEWVVSKQKLQFKYWVDVLLLKMFTHLAFVEGVGNEQVNLWG